MHEGGCLCGKIRYAVSVEPIVTIKCFCSFCRRSTGSDYLVEVMFDKSRLRVLRGETRIYNHVSDGSGKVVHVNFCADCGTKLFQGFERFSDKVGVFNGTFDDPDWFARTPENTNFFFLREAPDGAMIPAGYQVFHAHYWESDSTPSTAQVFQENTVITSKIREMSAGFAKRHGERT